MKINADFDQLTVEHAAQMDWIASPMPGVSRRMLDRIGDEVARATSIVRYAPGSQFSPHVHTGGEEFLVLDGVFQDEHGDFPPGTYVRNPVGTRHTPASESGCEIFVKLWQFDPADQTQMRVDTNELELRLDANLPGVSKAQLFETDRETVTIEQWDAGAEFALSHRGGLELLVLEGEFEAAGQILRRYSWLRVPQQQRVSVVVGATGSRVWLKAGHLRFVEAPHDA